VVVELDTPECKIVELRFWKGWAFSLKPGGHDAKPRWRRYATADVLLIALPLGITRFSIRSRSL
jgi:hypothetical protein